MGKGNAQLIPETIRGSNYFKSGGRFTPCDVQRRISVPVKKIRAALLEMAKRGEVERVGDDEFRRKRLGLRWIHKATLCDPKQLRKHRIAEEQAKAAGA